MALLYTKDLEAELLERIKLPSTWFRIGIRKQHLSRLLNIYFRVIRGYLFRGYVISTPYMYIMMFGLDEKKMLLNDLKWDRMRWSVARAILHNNRLEKNEVYKLNPKYTGKEIKLIRKWEPSPYKRVKLPPQIHSKGQ